MITLCEKCFPLHGYGEVLITGTDTDRCAVCGETERERLHTYENDPREDFKQLGPNSWAVREGVLK